MAIGMHSDAGVPFGAEDVVRAWNIYKDDYMRPSKTLLLATHEEPPLSREEMLAEIQRCKASLGKMEESVKAEPVQQGKCANCEHAMVTRFATALDYHCLHPVVGDREIGIAAERPAWCPLTHTGVA